MIERKIFECEHCHRKRLMNKTQMKKHEETCYHNPNSKSCITCGNFESEAPYREYHDEIPGGAYEYIDGYRECNAKLNIKDKLKTNCDLWTQLETVQEVPVQEQPKELTWKGIENYTWNDLQSHNFKYSDITSK